MLQGLGTKDSVLIEILCTRTNEQIKDINATYKESPFRLLCNPVTQWSVLMIALNSQNSSASWKTTTPKHSSPTGVKHTTICSTRFSNRTCVSNSPDFANGTTKR